MNTDTSTNTIINIDINTNINIVINMNTNMNINSPGLWPRGVLEMVLSTSFLISFHHFTDEIRLTLISLWERSIFKDTENRAAADAKSRLLKNITFS